MGARKLEEKVCIITGTGGTMGRAAALLFASEGARVVGCDLSEQSALETQQLVRAAGGAMESLSPCNLTDARACQALVDSQSSDSALSISSTTTQPWPI